MIVVQEGNRKSKFNGYNLYTRTTLLEGKEPKAILLYLHGLGHHCGHLDSAFRLFAEQGIVCYSYDHYGHGRSEPKEENNRCHMPDFNALVDDAFEYAKQIKASRSTEGATCPPIFIGGESLGGLIAAMAARKDQSMFAGMVLVAAALDKELNLILKIQASVAGLLAAIAPRARIVPAVVYTDLSEDAEVVEGYMKDPLNFIGNQRVLGMHLALGALRGLKKHYKEYTLPVFAIHATGDKVTWSEGSKRFIEQISSTRKAYKPVSSVSHVLLEGAPMLECVNDIAAWVIQTVNEAQGEAQPLPAAATEPAQ